MLTAETQVRWRMEYTLSMNVSTSSAYLTSTIKRGFVLAIDIDAFLEMIRFFTTLILNADESTTL